MSESIPLIFFEQILTVRYFSRPPKAVMVLDVRPMFHAVYMSPCWQYTVYMLITPSLLKWLEEYWLGHNLKLFFLLAVKNIFCVAWRKLILTLS